MKKDYKYYLIEDCKKKILKDEPDISKPVLVKKAKEMAKDLYNINFNY